MCLEIPAGKFKTKAASKLIMLMLVAITLILIIIFGVIGHRTIKVINDRRAQITTDTITEKQEVTQDFPLQPPEIKVLSDQSMEQFIDDFGHTQTVFYWEVEVNGKRAIKSYTIGGSVSLAFVPD